MFSKKKDAAKISDRTPVFHVRYIGNTETHVASGTGCSYQPVQRLWDNSPGERHLKKVAIHINTRGITMRPVDVTDPKQRPPNTELLKRQPSLEDQHAQSTEGLNRDFSIDDISFCNTDRAVNERIFSWICRNTAEGRLDCHAVLCSTRQKARTMAVVLSRAFHIAYKDWRTRNRQYFAAAMAQGNDKSNGSSNSNHNSKSSNNKSDNQSNSSSTPTSPHSPTPNGKRSMAPYYASADMTSERSVTSEHSSSMTSDQSSPMTEKCPSVRSERSEKFASSVTSEEPSSMTSEEPPTELKAPPRRKRSSVSHAQPSSTSSFTVQHSQPSTSSSRHSWAPSTSEPSSSKERHRQSTSFERHDLTFKSHDHYQTSTSFQGHQMSSSYHLRPEVSSYPLQESSTSFSRHPGSTSQGFAGRLSSILDPELAEEFGDIETLAADLDLEDDSD